eukprot:TRINITY_DN409_c0_g1_i3.p1 TRINITY_DN409_c0_g1~~TRINITY_DN409_c0_g1_i3.p1  ORF type:complete len:479 (+),score=132.46 TRINITY_DN409_c0_g1_i3:115-1551(+)
MTDAEKTASGVEPTSKATSSHTSTTMTTAATALDMTDQQQNVPEGFVWTPLTAALFYATSSILIMFANKLVLTHFAFPSFVFLGVLQGVTTLIMMHLLRAAGAISFPRATWALLASTFPVPLLFTLNNLTALGGMQHLNLPMFVVLRRFSILMTMVAERFVLGKRHSPSTQASVFLMLAGALVAAIYDMTFNLWGYIYVLANDVFTAANGVAVAHKYATKRAGTWGMLYVNTLFSVPAMLTYMIVMRPHEFQHLREFTQWSSPLFAMSLCLSGSLGFGINYGVFICTKLTSPLTTTVIGCLKNVVTTYGGMVMGYQINTQNFAGLTVSTFASVWYSYVAFYEGVAKRAAQQAKDEKAALSTAEEPPTSPISLATVPDDSRAVFGNPAPAVTQGVGTSSRVAMALRGPTLPDEGGGTEGRAQWSDPQAFTASPGGGPTVSRFSSPERFWSADDPRGASSASLVPSFISPVMNSSPAVWR